MKIVDIAEFYSERGGGIRSHLTTRGHVLRQLGHDHLVIAPGPRDEERILEPVPPATLDRHGSARVLRIAGPALPYDRTYHLLGRLDKVRTRARRERPDVLESHSPYLAHLAALACGRRTARVRTTFWHTGHLEAYLAPALRAWLGDVAARRAVSAAARLAARALAPFDAVFVASRAQERALRGAGVGSIVVVPFGVDTAVFRPDAAGEERRRALGAGGGRALIVAAGRLAAEKRWDVVLDACAAVASRRPSLLVVFGDGPERARLERRAPASVIFAGFEADRTRLAGAIACADVFVHACPCETYGLSIAEAVACGVPVVVPDRGAAPELARPGSSQVYASADAEACAAAIERVLERRGPEASARARDAARSVVTPEEHVRRVLSVYAELLALG